MLGSVTSVLVYGLGRKLFSRTIGILSGVISAFYMPSVFFEGELLASGWAAFWTVASISAFISAAEKPRKLNCFVLGLCGALSIINRPEFLLFFATGCLWLFVVWARQRIAIRELLRAILLLAGGFLTIASPAAIAGYRVIGKASILPYSGGINLYIGNNPHYKETINIRPGLAWRKLTELPADYGIKDRFEKERFFSNKALNYIRTQPAGFLKGLLYKTLQFLSSRETPRNLDIYLFRKWSSLLRVGVWKAGGFGFPYGLLLPLAIVGGVHACRKVSTPIWLFLVLYPSSVILVFVASRYRIPIIPIISILAAIGCTTIWQLFQSRKWAKLTSVFIIILTVAIASSIAGPFYAEQLDYQPEFYYGLADSLDKHGHTQEAIQAYSQAVSSRPDYVEAHHNLALLLVDQQRIEEAITHYHAALEADPQNAGLHEDLGAALFKQGKTEDAIKHYQKAIEIEPEKATVYDNLGTAFFHLNRVSEALQYYSKSIELNPNDAVSQNNIGNVLALQGELAQAVEHYEISLRLKPDDPETLNNTANALASLGKFSQATIKYNQALRFAPNDAGIYCNLAVCLEKQGRITEAIQAYQKALTIDPQNKRAQQALKKIPTIDPPHSSR